jgi:hypothetical protein
MLTRICAREQYLFLEAIVHDVKGRSQRFLCGERSEIDAVLGHVFSEMMLPIVAVALLFRLSRVHLPSES